MSTVKLVWITPDCERIIAYCARVSSPNNQDNPDYTKLIKYLIAKKHWSPLEMGSLCLEIVTSKAIAAQILRHRSLSAQEFSARYSKVESNEMYEARRQDVKNRQNSIDDMSEEDKEWFDQAQQDVINFTRVKYEESLKKGIAKEQSRMLLLQSATSRLYVSASIRSWLHYVDVRCDKSTQLEHREIAEKIKTILFDEVPTIASAMNW